MLEIALELAEVKLGVMEADGVRVGPAGSELARELDAVCERLRSELTPESVAELPAVHAVRAMFRAWGVDPARYRPSSEALLRRVAQGKGLYRVLNVVDINNLCSIETGWPAGSYDRAALLPPIALRPGRGGETYEGIGRHIWHTADRPVLADSAGPFGSPISDSTRTMIRETTTEVLAVIFAPAETADAALEQALVRHAERLQRWAGAQATRARIVS
jgi:DNA/RNA-binding domain of Phe-tRNA-synthetase-like protein